MLLTLSRVVRGVKSFHGLEACSLVMAAMFLKKHTDELILNLSETVKWYQHASAHAYMLMGTLVICFYLLMILGILKQ
jgi:hypothetical protein